MDKSEKSEKSEKPEKQEKSEKSAFFDVAYKLINDICD
jgi:hypothetical protein